MSTWQPDLAPLNDWIPRLFHLMKAVGDAASADLRVTGAMRGVMGSLASDGPRTAPDLARKRRVSRQRMQAILNDLLGAGLARRLANPSHRRSVLIELTDEGRRRLAEIRARETAMLARTAPAVSAADLAAALRLFDVLEREFGARLAEIGKVASAR